MLSTIWVHDLATGRCRSCSLLFSEHVLRHEKMYVCISIYIILRTINTSTTNMPASATYMKALPRVTTRRVIPCTSRRRPCVLHFLHSFSPWDCSPSFPCNLCLSFQRRHKALVSPIPTFGLSALSRGLLLRASSSQNGPAAL